MAQALPRSMPGTVLQQADLLPPCGQAGLQAPVQLLDAGAGPVVRLQQVAQLPHAVRVQVRLQHLLRQLLPVPHVAAEALQDLRRRALGGQPVQDAAPVRTENVRQRAAQPQAVVVQRLMHPVTGAAALRHQLAAVAAQLAQLAELYRVRIRLGIADD